MVWGALSLGVCLMVSLNIIRTIVLFVKPWLRATGEGLDERGCPLVVYRNKGRHVGLLPGQPLG